MAFGQTPTTTTEGSLASNQVFISSVATPNAANGDLTALEGGPISTDSNGNKTAPASMYVKDGSDLTQGTTTDTAVTGDTAGSLSAKLRGLSKIFTDIWDSVNHRIKVDGSGVTQPVSGSVSVSNLPATQAVSASSLPLPTGASTSAKQPALGTAGTASSDVLSVQGIASMTPLKTDASATTQPVSGSVSVSNLPATQAVSAASLPLPTGAALEAGHLAAIDTSTAAVSTVSGAKADSAATDNTSSWSIIALLKGIAGKLLTSIAVTQSGTWTVQPGNTANTTAWKVDGSAVTQPVSGTFWQATQPVSGTVTANAGTNMSTASLALEAGHLATIDTSTAASKTDLDTIVTNTNKIPASPAQEGGNLATIVTNTTGVATAANQTTVNTNTSNTATGIGGVADSAYTSGSGSVIAVLKGLYTRLANIVTMAFDNTSRLQISNYGKNSAAGDTALLVDSTGRTLIGRSSVAAYSLASTTTTGSTQNSSDITVGSYTEISIDINTTAQAGTAPTIQYFWERKGADNIYYVLWQSAVLTAATNTLSTSIGSGMAYPQSLGATGRLRWVIGGSATPTFTHTVNIQGK